MLIQRMIKPSMKEIDPPAPPIKVIHSGLYSCSQPTGATTHCSPLHLATAHPWACSKSSYKSKETFSHTMCWLTSEALEDRDLTQWSLYQFPGSSQRVVFLWSSLFPIPPAAYLLLGPSQTKYMTLQDWWEWGSWKWWRWWWWHFSFVDPSRPHLVRGQRE